MPGPLEGLIVVDCTWGMPGGITTMLYADYGATVIKVERPGGGPDRVGVTRSVFDRSKRSVELDLTHHDGVAALRSLIAVADVFIESFRPGVAADRGFGYEQVHAEHPRLVYCSISGYGQDTPDRDRPGFDCLVAARLGLMAEQAAGEPRPVFLGHPHLAYGTAFVAAMGTLSALRARDVTGHGQLVDVSLLDATMAQSAMNHFFNEANVSYLAKTGTEPGFGTMRIITDKFLCADNEYLMIHTGGDGGFYRTMEILGLAEHVRKIDGLEMSVPLDEEEYRLARHVAPTKFVERPRAEWIKLFHAADLAALPILRPAEVLNDEQVQFADVVVDLPALDGRVLRQAGPVIKFRASPPPAPKPAPVVGADNALLADIDAVRAAAGAGVPAPAKAHRIGSALEGIRVLDFSGFFATAYGAKFLSDLGADVIKVETLGGDQMRPLPDPFEACQRGKRNIAVDLRSAEGRAIVADLVKTADVIMHNLRPGKAEKLGIGFEQLTAIKPDLVYCYLPGFGSAGPKSHLKSFAPLVSGFTGLLYEGAGEGNEPVRRVLGNEDYNNGFLGAVAVLMGLAHRRRTGEGQYIESPHLHSSLFVTTEQCIDVATGKTVSPFVLDRDRWGIGPLYRCYATKDGFLALACVGDGAFERLVAALDLPQLKAPEFATAEGRDAHADAVVAAVQAHLSTLTSEEAFAVLDGARVACEIPKPDPYMSDFLWETWAEDAERVFAHDHPILGYIREIGLSTRLSDTPAVNKGPGPLLGQQTCEILTELGYSAERIDALLEKTCIDAARNPRTPVRN